MIFLKNRATINICGLEAKSFLQGLITNDINKIDSGEAIYSFMLSAQGRFLYDFFIISYNGAIILDCAFEYVDEIIKKLSFYKLRAKVEIKKSDLAVAAIIGDKPENDNQNIACFLDPRNSKMGYRLIGLESDLSTIIQDRESFDFYNYHRLNLKLVDDSDLLHDKSLILEYGFDDFNAIDYKKGCYVGQEVTARTHYRGLVRKKIFLVEILGATEIAKETSIFNGEIEIGKILSSVFFNQKLIALALIKNIGEGDNSINLMDLKLTLPEDFNKKSDDTLTGNYQIFLIN